MITEREAALRQCAAMMASRLRSIKRAAEEGGPHTWESADQASLDAYDMLIAEINGARPLFQEAV